MQLGADSFSRPSALIRARSRDHHHLPARTSLQQAADLRDVRQRDPLGQRGSFSIDGFGEAAQAYFGKDVNQLDLAECAMLAGIIQRPQLLFPFRHPDRAIERRNLVLDSMVETGAITKDEAERAKAEPLHLAQASVDASEAPYFVDLVHDQLHAEARRSRLQPRRVAHLHLARSRSAARSDRGGRIHDPCRRRAGGQAARARQESCGIAYIYPQVALVALNPHTGQVLALVGGRSYGNSQLNHAVAKRPTGSIFKPFVYATAFANGRRGHHAARQTKLFSPVTMLERRADHLRRGHRLRVHAAQL
jgi:penicillin-binding protein 1B